MPRHEVGPTPLILANILLVQTIVKGGLEVRALKHVADDGEGVVCANSVGLLLPLRRICSNGTGVPYGKGFPDCISILYCIDCYQ